MKAVTKFALWFAICLAPATTISVTGLIWGERFQYWWNYERGVPDGWHVVSDKCGCQWIVSHHDWNAQPRRREGSTCATPGTPRAKAFCEGSSR